MFKYFYSLDINFNSYSNCGVDELLVRLDKKYEELDQILATNNGKLFNVTAVNDDVTSDNNEIRANCSKFVEAVLFGHLANVATNPLIGSLISKRNHMKCFLKATLYQYFISPLAVVDNMLRSNGNSPDNEQTKVDDNLMMAELYISWAVSKFLITF